MIVTNTIDDSYKLLVCNPTIQYEQQRAARGECTHCPRNVAKRITVTGEPEVDRNGVVQIKINRSRRTIYYCSSAICTHGERICWLHPEFFAQYHVDHGFTSFL